MAIYSLALRQTSGSLASVGELTAGASVQHGVLEVGISQVSNGFGIIGLGRPNTQGVSVTGTALLPEDGGNTSTCQAKAAITWTTAPTRPAGFMKKAAPAFVGGYVWAFPQPIISQPGASVVLWSFEILANVDFWFVIDE